MQEVIIALAKVTPINVGLDMLADAAINYKTDKSHENCQRLRFVLGIVGLQLINESGNLDNVVKEHEEMEQLASALRHKN